MTSLPTREEIAEILYESYRAKNGYNTPWALLHPDRAYLWCGIADALLARLQPAWELVQLHERTDGAEVTIRSHDGKVVYEGVLPLFPHPEQRR